MYIGNINRLDILNHCAITYDSFKTFWLIQKCVLFVSNY